MLKDSAPSDRWIAKILPFPIFDDEFRKAVLCSRLNNVHFVCSVDVLSSGQFAATVLDWSEPLSPVLHSVLLQKIVMMEYLWLFAEAAGSVFTESVSYQLGFGQCA